MPRGAAPLCAVPRCAVRCDEVLCGAVLCCALIIFWYIPSTRIQTAGICTHVHKITKVTTPSSAQLSSAQLSSAQLNAVQQRSGAQHNAVRCRALCPMMWCWALLCHAVLYVLFRAYQNNYVCKTCMPRSFFFPGSLTPWHLQFAWFHLKCCRIYHLYLLFRSILPR